MATSISIILPAYQLGSVIEANIDAVFDALAALGPEVVVVDDGSSDDTGASIIRAKAHHPGLKVVTLPHNRGKGRALLEGSRVSSGATLVFLDADLDLPPEQIPSLLEAMKTHDVLVGTKKASMSGGSYPLVRRILSRVFALATGGVFGLPVSETQTGLKIFRRPVIESVGPDVRIERYAFDLELLVRAHARGFSMTEAPVTLGPGAAGATLRPSMMWNLARDTMRIAWWRLTETGFTTVREPRS